ncbi:MAG: GspH/FimT family pseudopilin [Acidobacteria bacterium]|nr:GspH/FimT family pseudopilin [Acidobacteriota bacterium]
MTRGGIRIRRGGDGRDGYSLPEILAVLLFFALLATSGAGGIRASLANARMSAATGRLTVLIRWMRTEALRRGTHVGIVFAPDPGGNLRFELRRDGDGDGIRSADVRAGIDPRFGGPFDLGREFPGVRFGILPRGRIPAIPPAGGALRNRDDPIQFGPADLISFSPRGQSSSGTLYLTDGDRRMTALVIYGPTIRLRVWKWRDAAGRWER